MQTLLKLTDVNLMKNNPPLKWTVCVVWQAGTPSLLCVCVCVVILMCAGPLDPALADQAKTQNTVNSRTQKKSLSQPIRAETTVPLSSPPASHWGVCVRLSEVCVSVPLRCVSVSQKKEPGRTEKTITSSPPLSYLPLFLSFSLSLPEEYWVFPLMCICAGSVCVSDIRHQGQVWKVHPTLG